MEETTLSGRLPKGNTVKKSNRLYSTNKNKVIEVICILLMLNFFYEGIYKIAYLKYWGFWVAHEPLIKSIGIFLKFAIPLIDLALVIGILKPAHRILAMYGIIITQLLFVFWVMSVYLFTGDLFWPYHAFWADKSTWLQKMSYALLLCWLAFIVIATTKKEKK